MFGCTDGIATVVAQDGDSGESEGSGESGEDETASPEPDLGTDPSPGCDAEPPQQPGGPFDPRVCRRKKVLLQFLWVEGEPDRTRRAA